MTTQIETERSSEESQGMGAVSVAELADPGWAWAAYEPTARRPWNLAGAAHLYRRAGFGADWAQLRQALAEGPQRTVDKLLRPPIDVAAFDRGYEASEKTAAGSVEGLRAWWLRRMIETPHPLLEKMTLFWHSYFAVNAGAVNNPRLMQEHLELLRNHALGSFRSLLQAISRDPAVLLGLGADRNRKAAPNDSFARPLLKVFTVGPRHCTTEDIREAARACTGQAVLRGQLRHLPQEHDDTVKHLLGRTGNFTADDVVRIVLEQPATAATVVRRLYRWLVSETEEPGDSLIAPLADSLARDYDIAKLAETMLRSNLFFSPRSYRQRIKCPIELAVGIVRALEGMVSATQLAQDAAGLGQDLCRPPTVQGWAGGLYWINTATVVKRHNLAGSLLHRGKPYESKLDPWAVAEKHGHPTPDAAARFLFDLFLQGDVAPDARDALLANAGAPADDSNGGPAAALRRLAHVVMTLPEYQLA
ncbi:MAG: DUF1800 domain-containing protein [Planctomycetes bacterium]|nr:DUF1800 domain-containing protein [Planctomycetota bacterium]